MGTEVRQTTHGKNEQYTKILVGNLNDTGYLDVDGGIILR
jgi:hypothetical protein